MNSLSIAIIIPTRNRASLLYDTLRALAVELPAAARRIVRVIDDASSAAHASRNKELCRHFGYAYTLLSRRGGPARARNAGVRHNTAEWVAFLDDDVQVMSGWFAALRASVKNAPAHVAGVEGAVIPSGRGLWDAEVANESGGLFLTANIAYRRKTLSLIGGFDEAFPGPFAEDHDVALRARRWGDIAFCPAMVVQHAPRTIHYLHYIIASPHRMKMLLDSEYLLYRKHPARYHTVRHARSFWGTLGALVGKNVLSAFRRRSLAACIRRPLQTGVLFAGACIEQITALCLAPRYIREYATKSFMPETKHIDWRATARLYQSRASITAADITARPRLWRSATFTVARSPVYQCLPALKKLATQCSNGGVYLRIDDVFLDDASTVKAMTRILHKTLVPFCAAIPLSHLENPAFLPLIRSLAGPNGAIGVHGVDHAGSFGPFASEILQLSHADLKGLAARTAKLRRPVVAFIPPFNAIDWNQICYLGQYYKIICGGPETLRFSGRIIAPVQLTSGAVYFPSVHPFYAAAADILAMNLLNKPMSVPVCITVHMPVEARDNFASFRRLVRAAQPRLQSWFELAKDRI